MTTIPAGWKLAPIEPTDDMEAAAEDNYEQTGATFPRWKLHYAAMLAAAPAAPVSTVEDADAQKEAVMHAIADALGHAYDCMRVWAAWGVGTMSQDDFHLVTDDAGRLGEIADAAIAAMRPAPAAGDALDYRAQGLEEAARIVEAFAAERQGDQSYALTAAAIEIRLRAAIAAQRKGDA